MIVLYCMLGRAQRALLLLLLPTPYSKSNPWNGRGVGKPLGCPKWNGRGMGKPLGCPKWNGRGVGKPLGFPI